jgi:two-component system sensor histidine kinase KdpD
MAQQDRGRLKVYLGYAPGIGKTYRMLSDAQQLKTQGKSVLIGFLETRDRPDIIAMNADFEQGARPSGVMDTESVLRRRPDVCLVDDPISEKRWEQILKLNAAGIDVWTTLDVSQMESLNDEVFQITGMRFRETIPDWIVEEADEIVLVDLSPRSLLHRLERGVVYPNQPITEEAKGYFNEAALVALRELALRQAAHEVGPHRTNSSASWSRRQSGDAERILLVITEDPSTAIVLRRGRRASDYLGANCIAVFVHSRRHFMDIPELQRNTITRHLDFARNMHIDTCVIRGRNRAQTLVEWARSNRVTQIFVSRTPQSRHAFAAFDFVDQILHEASELQVMVLSEQAG